MLLLSLDLSAQEVSKYEVRFGVGRTILGTGDIRTTTFENEFNYKLNSFFTTAISISYGKGDEQVFGSASYIQGNFNLFISPFKNTKAFDFRVGSGITYYVVSDIRAEYVGCGNGFCIGHNYTYERRDSFGYNVITEVSYSINNRFSLGLKLYTQPYFIGDINSGLILKSGIKI